jgi:hypothetical protein
MSANEVLDEMVNELIAAYMGEKAEEARAQEVAQ